MPNKIKPKRSYTTGAVPTTSDLDTHEMAINWADAKAYVKDDSGNILSVTLGGGSLPSTIAGTLTVQGDSYWSNVSLLLKGEGTFTDSSPTPKTVTSHGSVTASGAAKYGGASLSFPSSGSYLTVAGSSAFAFPGDFTIETWVNLSAAPSSFNGYWGSALVATYAGISGNPGWQLRLNGNSSGYNTINLYTGSTDLNWSYSFALNTWYHVAVTRSGSSIKAWVNGVQAGSTSTCSDDMTASSPNDLWIGRLNLSGYEFQLLGLMDDIRITKGVARVISTTTPEYPTSATYTLPVSLAVTS